MSSNVTAFLLSHQIKYNGPYPAPWCSFTSMDALYAIYFWGGSKKYVPTYSKLERPIVNRTDRSSALHNVTTHSNTKFDTLEKATEWCAEHWVKANEL